MNLLSAKMFLSRPLDSTEVLSFFHRLLKDDIMPEAEPLDVIGYRHIENGPWVQLICTKGQYVFDGRDGRPGVKFIAREELDIARVTVRLLELVALLEYELGAKFKSDELELELYDRREFPNNREVFLVLRDQLEQPGILLFDGSEVTWRSAADLRGPMRLGLQATQKPRPRLMA
jgi:hypothetical protein